MKRFFLFCAAVAVLSCSSSLLAATPAARLVQKNADWFQSDEGKATLDCVLTWQSEYGDWPKNKDTTKQPYSGDRAKISGTFDNGATSGELRALARAVRFTDEEKYRTAFLRGFDHILKAQYPNGGWPQYFPLSKKYHRHITFNDGTMVSLMEFLQDAVQHEDFAFLDQQRREFAKSAVARGIHCILRCQVKQKGKTTVWCAQHDEITLQPATARSYELPSLSGGESAGILLFLMNLKEPSKDVIGAVESGVAWYDSVKITGAKYKRRSELPNLIDDSASPIWARFYELETNRPFFCGRDGVKKYDISEIEAERRGGYSWYGNWGEKVARAYAKWPYRYSN